MLEPNDHKKKVKSNGGRYKRTGLLGRNENSCFFDRKHDVYVKKQLIIYLKQITSNLKRFKSYKYYNIKIKSSKLQFKFKAGIEISK